MSCEWSITNFQDIAKMFSSCSAFYVDFQVCVHSTMWSNLVYLVLNVLGRANGCFKLHANGFWNFQLPRDTHQGSPTRTIYKTFLFWWLLHFQCMYILISIVRTRRVSLNVRHTLLTRIPKNQYNTMERTVYKCQKGAAHRDNKRPNLDVIVGRYGLHAKHHTPPWWSRENVFDKKYIAFFHI